MHNKIVHSGSQIIFNKNKKIYTKTNVLLILICYNLFRTNCIENCVGNYF